MKKSVVILIALIYIASIAIVSFFGLQFKVFDAVVSVERIELLNSESFEESETWGKYVIIRPDPNGQYRYHIEYRVYPDNASNPKVEFTFDKSSAPNVTVDENGLVTFSSRGMVKVYIIATDGSNIQETITIIAN